MTVWFVTLEGVREEQEDDVVLQFQDTKGINLSPIERYLLDEISEVGRQKGHYHELPNIKTLRSDQDELIPREKAAVILITMKETQEKYGFLLNLKDEFNYEIRGIRPESCHQELSQDPSKVGKIFEGLVKNPHAFEDVNVVLPEDRY